MAPNLWTMKQGQQETTSRPAQRSSASQENLNRLVRIESHLSGRDGRTSSSDESANSDSGGAGLAAAELPETLKELRGKDPRFDPQSQHFDLTAFLKRAMEAFDQEHIKIGRAGVTMKNVTVRGSGQSLNFQHTFGDYLLSPFRMHQYLSFGQKPTKTILNHFNMLLESGEMLLVLGRPGSGCSTLLKTICGEMHGLQLDKDGEIHYNGVSRKQMMTEFKGEVLYNQEVDKHFPHLTVGQTLEHACALRMRSRRIEGETRESVIKLFTEVIMSVFGLTHTYHTRVGDDFVRGVSGGERKRVSIAEMALAASPLACWDNSTRGLDSSGALNFVQSLRRAADLTGSSHAVAAYQASQAIYDVFDKAIVLYEGREIYFGPARHAKRYFEHMGWACPPRQTDGDFITSVTNPVERRPKPGSEKKVPQTPEEFESYWRHSPEYFRLKEDIAEHETKYPINGSTQLQHISAAKKDMQADHVRPRSPYVVSIPMQIRLNIKRAYQRIWSDAAATFIPVFGNCIMALLVGSVFYATPDATTGFFSRSAVLFFAVLLNALSAIAEINSMYAQRVIVEKHKTYAFYHPFSDGIASFLADLPIKFCQAVAFNVVLYFMANLRREPSQFFLFFLVAYLTTMVMSLTFRIIAALTKSISQAMTIAGVIALAIVVYSGFIIPVPSMHPWFGWIRWINPLYYAFEMFITNEFHGRRFTCSARIPAYSPSIGSSWICNVRGSVAGEDTVSGDAYITAQYGYEYEHMWRNLGILIAFLVGFLIIYLVAIELNSNTTSAAEVLIFKKRKGPKADKISKEATLDNDIINGLELDHIDHSHTTSPIRSDSATKEDVFAWQNVVYDIPYQGQQRRLLDHVTGWVKPGTLTALMGTSGAGKTTLLDVLAQRVSLGVVTGDMLVNGNALDASFQRNTGYVQQQDLHLETSSVREALQFSATLRQPRTVSAREKEEHVEQVIALLNMESFADAIVGVPGKGLNVEQRKLLTIGVELAAKPQLLLFLDEPTSGLDSQSSWAICTVLRKLANTGQAILCTIHQPSAILFEQFDRLLFLRKGGQTVYFGDVGPNSRTLLDYFERNGGRTCDDTENPAEYMLEVANQKEIDWHKIWTESQEAKDLDSEILRISRKVPAASEAPALEDFTTNEFAMPFGVQLKEVTYRTFQQYWRTPGYLTAKFSLCIFAGLFIGFSFYDADASQQGMQNVLFSAFMLCIMFTPLVQQILPVFVDQRALYEARERPSKAYSWKAFFIANVVVELPYQVVASIIVYATLLYPIVGIPDGDRQGTVVLFCIVFFVYVSTFGMLCIAGIPDAQTAGAIVTLLFAMSLTFNGIMQPPAALPGFWIWMWRVSPFTYWISGIVSTMLHGRPIQCADAEFSIFDPPFSQTCGEYLSRHLSTVGGVLNNPNATSSCQLCSLTVADQFLAGDRIFYSERWRNFGVYCAYIIFNVVAAGFIYWFFRVRPTRGQKTDAVGSKKGKSASDKVDG